MNEKFFPELARRLRQEGVATGPAEENQLPVLLNGQVMWVETDGFIVLAAGARDDPKAARTCLSCIRVPAVPYTPAERRGGQA